MTVEPPSKQALALAARVWGERRAFELQAAERFTYLARELQELGASPTLQQLAREAADDERRHAELCFALSRRFGGVAATAEAPEARRTAPAHLDRHDALLYEIVAMCCVTETLSTALLGALVQAAKDSQARATMQAILRDEVRHSRLGWAYLTEAPHPGGLAAVSSRLPALLEATLQDDPSRGVPLGPREAELAGLGQLTRDERRRVVGETLRQVVFPGLERYGVDVTGGRRWLETGPWAAAPQT